MRKVLACLVGFLVLLCTAQIASAEIDVRLTIEGCNNDTYCQAEIGEDTLSCPNDCPYVPPTPTPTDGEDSDRNRSGTRRALIFSNIQIVVDESSALLTWNTSRPTQSTISWGIDNKQDKGSLGEIAFTTEHRVKITNLLESTPYSFLLQARDSSGVAISYLGNFITQGQIRYEFPANVSDAKASAKDNEILLTWQNPPLDTFSYVRVVKSEKGYPTHPLQGEVIYEGGGQSFVDREVVAGKDYYYGFFVRTTSGAYSSGVILSGRSQVMPSPVGPSYGVGLGLEEVEFIQQSLPLSFAGEAIPIRSDEFLLVRFPLTDESLKSAALVLYLNREDVPASTFLMRYNPDNNMIEATIPPLYLDGVYSFTIDRVENATFSPLVRGSFIMESGEIPEEKLTFWGWLKKLFFALLELFRLILSFILGIFR